MLEVRDLAFGFPGRTVGREVSFSLGGTRWQTVTRVVLPGALPGIVTGIMLSLGRCIGETAAVIFTAAVP